VCRLLLTVRAFKFPFFDLDSFVVYDSHAASNAHYQGVGHAASILCMILSAKITASAMIECTAGDGLVLSNWQSL